MQQDARLFAHFCSRALQPLATLRQQPTTAAAATAAAAATHFQRKNGVINGLSHNLDDELSFYSNTLSSIY